VDGNNTGGRASDKLPEGAPFSSRRPGGGEPMTVPELGSIIYNRLRRPIED